MADKPYFPQVSISQIETGKKDITANKVVYLRAALNKPITYFYPIHPFDIKIEDDELSILEQELLMQAKMLKPDDLKKLIAQARALADLSETNLIFSF